MRKLRTCLYALVAAVAVHAAGPTAHADPERAPASRPATKDATPASSYPRIAMLWTTADVPGDPWANHARHDVIVTSIHNLGLQWRHHKHPAMVESILPKTVPIALKNLAKIHKHNPKAIVLCEVYFYEERDGFYPPNHPWWLRDKKGKRVQFWPGAYRCDLSNAQYVSHVVRRISAVHKALGDAAGIYLDNLRTDPPSKAAWSSLLKQIRIACGAKMPILVNAGFGSKDLAWVAPLVNGLNFENAIHKTADGNTEAFYARIGRYEKLCRRPHLSVNEVFGKPTDLAAMRRELFRTLVYTDMAFLFADSVVAHKHPWYRIWDAPLGLPLGAPARPGKALPARREFAGGLVLYLPQNAKVPVTVPLKAEMLDVVEKKKVARVKLRPGTGAMLLHLKKIRPKSKPPASQPAKKTQ